MVEVAAIIGGYVTILLVALRQTEKYRKDINTKMNGMVTKDSYQVVQDNLLHTLERYAQKLDTIEDEVKVQRDILIRVDERVKLWMDHNDNVP